MEDGFSHIQQLVSTSNYLSDITYTNKQAKMRKN
jgi:hypothetical protein